MGDNAERWLELNKANWDERVPIHVGGAFYDVAGFRETRDMLREFEPREVGEVTGKSLVHLQCHFGLDTLSWAARGAEVTGLDFSAPAIAAAQALAAELGLEADFVVSDLYEAVSALGGKKYDIVYTGLGALCWLPDLTRWAAVVSELIKPGGFLYLTEFHPFTNILDEATGRTVENDYFDESARVWDEPGTYADLSAKTENNLSVEWEHTLGTIVSAIAGAGLRIEFLHEHDYTLFPRFETLVRQHHNEIYRVPEGAPRIPMMYSIRASKS